MPGQAKTCSMTNVPPTSVPTWRARTVTTGSIAFFRAWRTTTVRSASPFARAVRMYSAPSTSSMPERRKRESGAASPTPSVKAGSAVVRQRLYGVVPEGGVARRREPAGPERDREDQHDAEPEARQGHAHEGQSRDAAVQPRARVAGGQDAGRKGDRECDEERRQHELQGGGQEPANERERRLLADPGLAEVAAEQVADPQSVLDPQRAVEPEVRPERGQRRRRRLAPELDRGRIARDEPHQREDDDRDHEQDRDELDQTRGEVAPHGSRTGARGPGSPRPAEVSPARCPGGWAVRAR